MKAQARRILPSFVWNGLKSVKQRVASPASVQKYMELAGYTVAQREDYYSPMSSVSELRSTFGRWNRPSRLKGVKYDLDSMKRDLSGLLSKYLDEFLQFPPYGELVKKGFGPGYTAVDALTLYMMIRHIKPKRYLEVGSGLSTYYCSLAAAKNASEGNPVRITCIEPYPFQNLHTIPDIELIVKKVQEVDVALFEELQENDVFFIDSSHVLKIDGDVPFLYLEALPALKAGVNIHIHDVPFPYNIPYPPQLWVFGRDWPMLWNEAMVVQAFLCFNNDFKIVMSTPLIRGSDEAFLRSRIPFYETIEQNPNTFSSLWLKRVS